MRSSIVVLSLLSVLFAVCASAAFSTDKILPGSAETHHQPLEPHHSLHHPFDQSIVYWKYGGATVMTKNFIRLVPASQSKAGWLWNDYPLESEDWEIEFALRVQSKPHFGGDGFAFWILSGDHDPSYHFEPDYLNGPMFGLKEDFKGIGVIFDTYDNDGKRNNPCVFVVRNEEGRFGVHDHDNDFSEVMVKNTPDSTSNFNCFSSYRNTKDPYKVLVRYRRKVLHVYVQDGLWGTNKGEYKYCLSVRVEMPSTVTEKHLAFTALTGQVADKVDILEISTRYLDEKDAYIDDAKLEHAAGSARSKWSTVFWILMFAAGAGLVFWTGKDLSFLSMHRSGQLNAVYFCREINRLIVFHIALHFLVCLILLITGSWLGIILNSPLLAYRIFTVAKGTYEIDPAVLSGGGNNKNPISFDNQLYLMISCYVICDVYYFIKIILA